jgi:Helix-turn-helix domain
MGLQRAIKAEPSLADVMAKLDAISERLDRLLPSPAAPPPRWITTKDAADRAHIGAQCIRNWCRRYAIGQRIGGQWRVDAALLDAFLCDRGRRPG